MRSNKNVTLIGGIVHIGEVIDKGSFQLRKFIIQETQSRYPSTFEITLSGDGVDSIESYGLGELIVVEGYIKGRSYTTKEGKEGVWLSISATEIRPASKEGGSYGSR